MEKVVIDASVLVKWFVQELDSDRALVLRDKHVNGEIELAAPILILYETLNALRYTGLFSSRQLKEIAVSIQNYGISFFGLEGKTGELTLDAVEENDLTIYDGAYLGLAMNLEAELVTADHKLVARLGKDYAKRVKLLQVT
jgi:predicted nucleic acid-binding protein